MVKVYSLSLKVFLLKDISYEEVIQKCTTLIDCALASDSDMLKFHNSKIYKNYCFSSLFPVKIKEEKVYKAGEIYTMLIRTVDPSLKDYFVNVLPKTRTEEMQGLIIKERKIKRGMLQKVISKTPILLKTNEGYWANTLSLDECLDGLKNRLINKYEYFTNQKIENRNFNMFLKLKKKWIALLMKCL